jgi:hypothetical protein
MHGMSRVGRAAATLTGRAGTATCGGAAGHEAPRSVSFEDELPRLPFGTLDARMLRHRCRAETDARLV